MDWVNIVSFVIPVSGYRERFRRWLWKQIYGGYARRVAKVVEIPPMAIAGGNPAKVFANRNVEHFHELKEQGRFA